MTEGQNHRITLNKLFSKKVFICVEQIPYLYFIRSALGGKGLGQRILRQTGPAEVLGFSWDTLTSTDVISRLRSVIFEWSW